MVGQESKEAIAERLTLTRVALGYEQQATFCAALDDGMTPQRWNNYESGRDRLTLNVALLICRRFHVTLDWLYRGDPSGLPLRLVNAIEELRAASRAAVSRKRRK